MSLPDEPTIERTTDLDMSVDELWTLISTSDGWSSWLTDEADIVVAPDTIGTTIDDGVVREIRVDSVSDGRRVGFTWWDRDDSSSASFVHLEIVELPDNRSQLHVSERFIGVTSTTAMSCSTAVSWDVRMVSLWLLASHCTVIA